MHKNGLTLIEVVVSTVILAIVVAGLANIFVAGKRLVLHSRSRMTVGELGRFYMDPLQRFVREEESTLGAGDGWDGANNGLSLGVRNCAAQPGCAAQTVDAIPYTPVSYDVTAVGATDLRQVAITINWTEPQ